MLELRLIFGAWLIFALVVVASYTANLTVFLGQKSKSVKFDSIEKVTKCVKKKAMLQGSGLHENA